MTRRLTFSLLFVFLFITRLCHSGLVWVEEAYPLAGAIQILHGNGQTVRNQRGRGRPRVNLNKGQE